MTVKIGGYGAMAVVKIGGGAMAVVKTGGDSAMTVAKIGGGGATAHFRLMPARQ